MSTPDLRSRLEALKAPAPRMVVATPLAEIDRQLHLEKVVDFAGEIAVTVNEVKAVASECMGAIERFKREAPAAISGAVRQELAPSITVAKAHDHALGNCVQEIALMRGEVDSLRGTIKAVVGICFVFWVATAVVIFASR